MTPNFLGITPYLICHDAQAESAWLIQVLGFREKSRWTNADGSLTNIELQVGDNEIWLDHYPDRAAPPEPGWIGIWVDDVTAMRARVQAAGVDCAPPRNRNHGVREIGVTDPEGRVWGFLQRLPGTP